LPPASEFAVLNDVKSVSAQPMVPDNRAGLLALYDTGMPYVYGYLLARCGQASLAQELTADTVLAAVDAVQRRQSRLVSTACLVGIARHKLVDHWRPEARQERYLRAVASTMPWPRIAGTCAESASLLVTRRPSDLSRSNVRYGVIARSRSRVATRAAASIHAGPRALYRREINGRLGQPAVGTRAFGRRLALRARIICGLRRRSSAELADLLAVPGAICACEVLQWLGAPRKLRRYAC